MGSNIELLADRVRRYRDGSIPYLRSSDCNDILAILAALEGEPDANQAVLREAIEVWIVRRLFAQTTTSPTKSEGA